MTAEVSPSRSFAADLAAQLGLLAKHEKEQKQQQQKLMAQQREKLHQVQLQQLQSLQQRQQQLEAEMRKNAAAAAAVEKQVHAAAAAATAKSAANNNSLALAKAVSMSELEASQLQLQLLLQESGGHLTSAGSHEGHPNFQSNQANSSGTGGTMTLPKKLFQTAAATFTGNSASMCQLVPHRYVHRKNSFENLICDWHLTYVYSLHP